MSIVICDMFSFLKSGHLYVKSFAIFSQLGIAPLHNASGQSNKQVVETLIKAGATVNIANKVSYQIQ